MKNIFKLSTLDKGKKAADGNRKNMTAPGKEVSEKVQETEPVVAARKSGRIKMLFIRIAGYSAGLAGGACLWSVLVWMRRIYYIYRYYGYWSVDYGELAIAFFGAALFGFGVCLVGKYGKYMAEVPLEREKGIYGMPLEAGIGIYCLLAAAAIMLGMAADMISVVGAMVLIVSFLLLHLCENIAQRKARGTLKSNSFWVRIKKAAADAGIVMPFMVKCSIAAVLLGIWLLILVQKMAFYWFTGGLYGIVRVFMAYLLAILIPAYFLYACQAFHRLESAGEKLAGNVEGYRVDSRWMPAVMKKHAENLNSISEDINRQVEARLKSERLKTELITNVSHDIKTPLTSIINYADLISREESDNPRIKEYAEVLGNQSQKLKRLIENLIEASKASTGNVKVELKPCNLNVLLAQITGEYEKSMEEHSLTLVMAPMKEEIYVMADGSQLWRVFDNLLGNICKYALEGTRVYLDAAVHDKVEITVKNISRQQLNLSEDELMERFTRGDESRSTSGNGLGLSIAQSLMKLQNGSLHLVIDGDLFKAIVKIERCEAPKEESGR